ncbi:MAG: AAA family ATPase, partial [Actinomycetota bacterium]|nr:AAA family ATPase [Actinomycetota bacterium]
FWDRVKLFLIPVGLLVFFALAAMGDNPLLPFSAAMDEQLGAKWWLVVLAIAEVFRQLHLWVTERSPAYYEFWSQRVFGRWERRIGSVNDWTRFRISRVLRVVAVFVIFGFVLAAATDTSFVLALVQLPASIFQALPLVLQLMFILALSVLQFVAIFWFLSKGGTEVYFPDDIKTRFYDVWGQDSVLEKIKENIVFLENPESIEEKGGYVPGGILLWGPPGTGKTLMAEAVAGETGRPYVFVDPGAFQAMFMGVGILKVKALFRKLRKLSVRYGGVIVFFDEADSLGNRGALTPGGIFGGAGIVGGLDPTAPSCNGTSYLSADAASMLFLNELAPSSGPEAPRRVVDRIMPMGMGGGGMGTLQALLTELSGMKKPRGFTNRVVRRVLGMRPKPPPKYRMLIMMATNMPQALDEALLRPGRIDRIYKVGYPSKPGRVRTYEGYLSKVRNELTPDDVDKLATITPYATGATIKDLINEALINAIRAGREDITWADIIKAKHLKDIGPPEDSEYIERERHAVALHEACHAVVAHRVRHHLMIDVATIERRGDIGGFVSGIPPEDRFVLWRSEYEADIMTSLASLAGERMFFDGDSSAGVSGDLKQATTIATLMEGYLGMGSTIACHAVTNDAGIGGGGRPKGDQDKEKDLLESSLGGRIEDKLADLMARTIDLLAENRTAVLAVTHALETYKTVTGDDVEAIIEGRRGSLIDGTPYATAEFSRLAEEYHAQVVAAHKGHANVDGPMPVFNGNRAILAPAADDLALDPTKIELTEAELAGRLSRRPEVDDAASFGDGSAGEDGSPEPAGD